MKNIVFHHVPKCAGMSLVMGLALSYYPLHLLRYGKKGFTGRLNARAAHETASARGHDDYALRRDILHYQLEWADAPFVSGHYPFCPKVYEHFSKQWDFITVLRDPVERWYSEYFWNRYKDHDYKKTDLDIEDYLQSAQGRNDTKLYINFFSTRKPDEMSVSEAHFQQAIQSLGSFSVLGDVKNMAAFQAKMKNKYGRSPWIPKRNASPAPQNERVRPDKNSDFHKLLLREMEADIAIYEHAKKYL